MIFSFFKVKRKKQTLGSRQKVSFFLWTEIYILQQQKGKIGTIMCDALRDVFVMEQNFGMSKIFQRENYKRRK